jgi:hypothetical protein
MPDNIVGTAYVTVRALTRGVRDEIRRGFDQGAKRAQKDVDRRGRKLGDSFAESVGEGITAGKIPDAVAGQVAQAGRQAAQRLRESRRVFLQINKDYLEDVHREALRRNREEDRLRRDSERSEERSLNARLRAQVRLNDRIHALALQENRRRDAELRRRRVADDQAAQARVRSARDAALAEIRSSIRVGKAYETETRRVSNAIKAMRKGHDELLKEVEENITTRVRRGVDRATFEARGGGRRIGRTLGRAIGRELAFEIRRFPILPFVLAAFVPVIAGASKVIAAFVGELISLLSPIGPAIGASLAIAAGAFVAVGQGFGTFITAIKTEGPALDAFKDRLEETRDRLRDMGHSIQDVLLEPLNDSIDRAANALLPRFNRELTQTGRVLANASSSLAGLTEDPFFQARLGTILSSNNRSLSSFAQTSRNLADIIVTLLAAATPLVEQFAAYTAQVTSSWAASLRLAQASGELADWFRRQGEFLQQLGRIASNVRTTLGNLFEVASRDAENLWSRIEGLTSRWRAFTESAAGRNRIAEYLDRARGVVIEVNGLFGDLFRMVGNGLANNTESLIDFVRALRFQVLPALADMAEAFAGMGPAFTQLVVTTASFFAELANTGILNTFLTTLSSVFSVLQSVLTLPIVGQVAQWSLAFLAFGKALNIITLGAFTRALTPLLGRLGEVGLAFRLVGRQALAAAGGAGIGALRGSLGLLMSTLGGPLGIAIIGVVTALGFLAVSHANAEQAAAEQEAELLELTGTLDRATGAITNQTREMVAEKAEAQGLLGVVERLGLEQGVLADGATGGAEALAQLERALEASNARLAQSVDLTEANRLAQEASNDVSFQSQGMSAQLESALESLNFTQEDFNEAILEGGQKLDDFLGGLLRAGAITPEAADEIRTLADENRELAEFVEQTNAALEAERDRLREVANEAGVTSDQVRTLADSLEVLGDEFASVDDKARALDNALQVLSGGQLDVDKTARDLHKTFRDVEDVFVDTAASAEKGETVYLNLSSAIDESTGKLDQTTEVGATVAETYDNLFKRASDAALAIAQSGGSAEDVRAPFDSMIGQFQGLLEAAGATPPEIEAITSSLQSVPLDTIVSLILQDEVTDPVQEAENLLNEFDGIEAVAKLFGDDLDLAQKIVANRDNLDELDAVVATATADLDDSDARDISDKLFILLSQLDSENPTPEASLDPSVLYRTKAAVDRQLENLGNQKPTPEVRAEIREWQAKRLQVLGQISNLDKERPTPRVNADTQVWNEKRLQVQRNINSLDKAKATPTVSAKDNATRILDAIRNVLNALPTSKTINVTTVHNTKGGLRGSAANGGIARPGMSITTAAGGMIRKAAGGLLAERAPMIAQGGSNILWAEPETHAESYIPWAPAKRPRATRILDRTAQEFGYRLHPMQDGGIVSRAASLLNESSSGTVSTSTVTEAAPVIQVSVDGPEVQVRAEEIARRVMTEYRRHQSLYSSIPRG